MVTIIFVEWWSVTAFDLANKSQLHNCLPPLAPGGDQLDAYYKLTQAVVI